MKSQLVCFVRKWKNRILRREADQAEQGSGAYEDIPESSWGDIPVSLVGGVESELSQHHFTNLVAVTDLCLSGVKDIEIYEKISYRKRYGEFETVGRVPSYLPQRFYACRHSFDEPNLAIKPRPGLSRGVTCPV